MTNPYVVSYIETRLDNMQETPAMWGSATCLELQYLQLLETWLVVSRPDLYSQNSKYIMDEYERFRTQQGFPVHLPLAHHLDSRLVVEKLAKFRALIECNLRQIDKDHAPSLRESMAFADGARLVIRTMTRTWRERDDLIIQAYRRIFLLEEPPAIRQALFRALRSYDIPELCVKYEGCHQEGNEIVWPDGERWPTRSSCAR